MNNWKLIQNRSQLEAAISDINRCDVVCADTETTGLSPYGGDHIIGISVYLPQLDINYYFPFRHGSGRVEVNYSKTNHEDKSFEDMTWAGEAKGDLFLSYWFQRYRQQADFKNLPEKLMEPLREVWGKEGVKYIFHNARFDLHFLAQDGFPIPDTVHDTMLSLHLVNEDWWGMTVKAPYKISEKDVRGNRWPRDMKGLWARHGDNLLTRQQPGNRRLKWQSVRIGLPEADKGEEKLREARIMFEDRLTDFIMDRMDEEGNPYLDELRYKKEPSPTRLSKRYNKPVARANELNGGHRRWLNKNSPRYVVIPKDYKYWREGVYEYDGEVLEEVTDTGHDPVFNSEPFYEMVAYGKQWQRIRDKLDVDEKAEMWMLPADEVAYYACLDTELTWGVYNWCLPIIEAWDNLDLHDNWQDIQTELAWDMERNGFRLDKEYARRELVKFRERSEILHRLIIGCLSNLELQLDLDEVPSEYRDEAKQYDDAWEAVQDGFVERSGMELSQVFNPGSPQQLIAALEAGILRSDCSDYIPEWFDPEVRVNARTYDAAPSSSARGTLEDYEDHPFVQLLWAYRKNHKSADVYLKNWLAIADENSVVRGYQMVPDGTVSGRFSSKNPNLQNVPDRNGYTVKKSIRTYDSNWMFLALDYGQLELRLATWIAENVLKFGNREMTRLFNAGEDLHAWVAEKLGVRELLYPGKSLREIARVNGVDFDELVEEKDGDVEAAERVIYKGYIRQVGKTCNFGLLYNGTEYMLARLLRIELDKARVLHDKWRELFPAFEMAQEYYTEQAMTRRPRPDGTGSVMYVTQPISGRHRKFQHYDTSKWYTDENGVSKTFNQRLVEAEKAWNNIVQGLGGYICTYAGLKIVRKYGRDVLRWFANIHDALDGHIKRDVLHIIPDIMDIMTDFPVEPALEVDLEASLHNWQDMGEVRDLETFIVTQGESGY